MSWLGLSACLLAGCGSAGTEPHVAVELRARIGSVAAPFALRALPEVRSEFQAYSIIGEVRLALWPWQFGMRLPVATSSVEQPGGSYVADYTLGNPVLFVERSIAEAEHSEQGVRTRTSLRLAAGLPVAGHGPPDSLVRNRVLSASDALEGWRESELFQPGVLPTVVEGRSHVEVKHWRAGAHLKLPVLLRTSSASLPSEVSTHAVAFMPVLTLGGAWQPLCWLGLGASTSATVLAPAPVSPARDIGRSGSFQTTIDPFVHFTARQVAAKLDLLAALGGPLAGTFGLGATIVLRLP